MDERTESTDRVMTDIDNTLRELRKRRFDHARSDLRWMLSTFAIGAVGGLAIGAVVATRWPWLLAWLT